MNEYLVTVKYKVFATSPQEAIDKAARYGCDLMYANKQDITKRLGRTPEVDTIDCDVQNPTTGEILL